MEEGMKPVKLHHSESEGFYRRVPVGEFVGGSLCDFFESLGMD